MVSGLLYERDLGIGCKHVTEAGRIHFTSEHVCDGHSVQGIPQPPASLTSSSTNTALQQSRYLCKAATSL